MEYDNVTGKLWDSVTAPQPDNGTYFEEPKCHKCGCPVSSQWLYCPYCGADLEPEYRLSLRFGAN